MDIRKVGVEEELLLVDPATRLAAPRSDDVTAGEELEQELFLHQVETTTDPTDRRAELEHRIRAARRTAGEAAAASGLALVACGAEPLRGAPARITPNQRYEDLLARFGDVAR